MLQRFSHTSNMIREWFRDPLLRFQASVLALLLLTGVGTVMYMMLEEWTMVDSLYMTVITIATVGFGEVRELSDGGRVFTIFLILGGVGLATYAISNAVSLALGPVLWDSIHERRIKRMIQRMENHYIVCGYGRMGRQIARDLSARREPFVLVDSNPNLRDLLPHEDTPYIIGDATLDETLEEANIAKARGVVAALSNDASNIMTVLTARELNPNIFIVARVVRQETERKLLRAGANQVINPYQIGGHRMALTLLRPAVHHFLERIFHFGEGEDIDIGQLDVQDDSRLVGQTIASCDLRRKFNVNILAITYPNKQMIITPSPDTPIETGSSLIVIGAPQDIYDLERRNENDAV
jgi:voltage-gated potassium channel